MAAEKTNTPKPNKSAFIRSQPTELSAADVVEKAKADGLTITPGLVYEVRSQVQSKRKAKKTAAKKTSAVTKSAAQKPAKTTKADFVRKLPTASPKEIIARAKAEGIKINLDYVYKVRSSSKAGKAKTKTETRVATPRRKGVAVARPIATASSAEDLLRAVAAEIGLARAMEILAAERARVRAVIGG
jgi:outer membrane receptor for Fe3+-dicitrate